MNCIFPNKQGALWSNDYTKWLNPHNQNYIIQEKFIRNVEKYHGLELMCDRSFSICTYQRHLIHIKNLPVYLK